MTTLHGIELLVPVSPSYAGILSPDALHFLASLARMFENRRQDLLRRRVERQGELDAGIFPDFLPQTASIRETEWRVAPAPADLQDRRVEITGPPERKMIINALNSGASVYMADFEDAHSPTWDNTLQGQINLRDAVNGEITYTSPEGKFYQLNPQPATLMVRPRGWHLVEKHLLIDGKPISGALFDFGLFFFHNARALLAQGSGPYFYLPKLENHLEARLWNDVFNLAQDKLGIPRGSIRATVLIENLLASYEMDEILHELREHSAGLNCGRWDYIFSAIRKFRRHPRFILPNRAQVTMTTSFMRAYSLLLIKTCHRRGIHAMGGMAAQIPIKGDPVANEIALEKVRADKERESQDGHDGTWVAHPGLVPLAKEVFDRNMPAANQIARQRPDVCVTAQDLLPFVAGTITEEGVRLNIDVALQYLASWLGGNGCVPIYNLMEDAATAEISRAQLWQWVHNDAAGLEDGRPITATLFRSLVPQTMSMLAEMMGETAFDAGNYERARQLLDQLVLEETFTEFLTLPAYQFLS